MTHRYTARIDWARTDEGFASGRYSRAHVWRFDEGLAVPASASPLHVPAPWARADAVDPEEAFVAALASCHMLFVLHLAATAGFVVDRYRDAPVGTMGRHPSGAEFLARVELRPEAVFSGDRRPDAAAIEALHHRAHALCYLAQSVRSEVVVSPVLPEERTA